MFIDPELLVGAAKDAGIKVPKYPDRIERNRNLFPHFYVYCVIQIGRPVFSPNEHIENAKIIASIPDNKIKNVSLKELVNMGVKINEFKDLLN